MEREQIIRALECLTGEEVMFCRECGYNKVGAFSCRKELSKDALALIKELTEENERLEDNLIKQSTENIMLLIEQQEIKANTVRRMQSDIQEACLKGGIWPAFVAGVVRGVGEKILEENK